MKEADICMIQAKRWSRSLIEKTRERETQKNSPSITANSGGEGGGVMLLPWEQSEQHEDRGITVGSDRSHSGVVRGESRPEWAQQ